MSNESLERFYRIKLLCFELYILNKKYNKNKNKATLKDIKKCEKRLIALAKHKI
jgi:hypothetical protein